jgi:hypothetical protein
VAVERTEDNAANCIIIGGIKDSALESCSRGRKRCQELKIRECECGDDYEGRRQWLRTQDSDTCRDDGDNEKELCVHGRHR